MADRYSPEEERRHDQHEAGDGTGDADVEQDLARAERLADANDRAQRARLDAAEAQKSGMK